MRRAEKGDQKKAYICTGFGKPQLWAVNPKGQKVWEDPKRIPAPPFTVAGW